MQLFLRQDAHAIISTFNYFDVGRKGYITKCEMQQALSILLGGRRFDHAEMNYIMRIFDDNFDGGVSFEEFLEVLMDGGESDRAGESKMPDQLDDDLEHVFCTLDTDNNGTISRNDLKQALRRIEVDLSDQELDQVMERFDGCEMNFQQFKSFMTS